MSGSRFYVFSENCLKTALSEYIDEAIEHYPESKALIYIVEDAVRDFFNSKYTEKFVSGDSPEQEKPVKEITIPTLPDGMKVTHPKIRTVAEQEEEEDDATEINDSQPQQEAQSQPILSWDDDCD